MRGISFLIIVVVITHFNSYAQSTKEVMGGFNQIIDISEFHGGQFRVSAYAKAENSNINVSLVHLFASFNNPNGFNKSALVSASNWEEYVLEGPVDENSDKLVFGAYYYGIGKYYFDKFDVKVKMPGGEWKALNIANYNFENDEIENAKPINSDFYKWIFSKNDGFAHTITTDNPFEGKHALLIDGSSKTDFGRYFEANGIKIYYEFHGHGQDTILFLHGNGQHIKSFSNQIPEFSKEFTVLAMDSRAQGYTSDDGKIITYELMAEDVNALLNSLNIKRINILGWSDGGNTGLILSMKHPEKVKKLATMGANLFCDKTSVAEDDIASLEAQKEKLEAANTPDTDYQLRMVNLMLNEPQIDPYELKSITCPVLIMAGSNDVIKRGHTKLIAKKIKNSTLLIFKEGSHYEPQNNPDRFNKTVLAFFRQ